MERTRRRVGRNPEGLVTGVGKENVKFRRPTDGVGSPGDCRKEESDRRPQLELKRESGPRPHPCPSLRRRPGENGGGRSRDPGREFGVRKAPRRLKARRSYWLQEGWRRVSAAAGGGASRGGCRGGGGVASGGASWARGPDGAGTRVDSASAGAEGRSRRSEEVGAGSPRTRSSSDSEASSPRASANSQRGRPPRSSPGHPRRLPPSRTSPRGLSLYRERPLGPDGPEGGRGSARSRGPVEGERRLGASVPAFLFRPSRRAGSLLLRGEGRG